VIAEFLISKVK